MYYKLVRPDGFDFYTGNAINYADNIGKIVKAPMYNKGKGLCSDGVIHACKKPLDCFVGAQIPCRAFLVEGHQVLNDGEKYGFKQLRVVSEIQDLDDLFGFKYYEAINPVNPFKLPTNEVKLEYLDKLKDWASVRDSVRASVWDSVRASVWNSVRASVWDSVGDSVWNSVRDSVWNSVWNSVRDSVWNSVGASVWNSVWDSVRDSVRASVGASVWDSVGDAVRAYIGSLYPNISKWQSTVKVNRAYPYPYQSAVDLWKQGIVASSDGRMWRFHSGEKANIIWKGTVD